jgi:hypothetical protein
MPCTLDPLAARLALPTVRSPGRHRPARCLPSRPVAAGLAGLLGLLALPAASGAAPPPTESAASGAGAGAQPPPAAYGPEPAASASDLARLREELRAATDRLARQEDELRAIAARLDEAQVRAAAFAQRAADLPATIDQRVEHFFSRHPLVGAIRGGLSLGGFVQADYQMRESSDDQLNSVTGAPLNQNYVFIRRARLRLSADYGVVGGLVELDGNTVNGTTARVIGAEVSLRWPPPTPERPSYIGLTAGLFKIPFGFEVGQRDTDRLFMERSTSERAFFPGEYDLGARLSGGWTFLRYAVAAMNGDPLGEKNFPGRDPNSAKDFIGRVGVDFDFARPRVPIRLAAGVSGLAGTGFTKGTTATKDVVVWRDANDNGVLDPGELQIIPGSAATQSRNFNRFALGGDVQFGLKIPVLGWLMLYGELVSASNLDRSIVVAAPSSASDRDLRELGWYAAATLELTRWAQVGVRYDAYNPDLDSTDRRKGNPVLTDLSYSTLAVVGALRYQALGRLSVEYDINRNHNGRDATGRPTNLADNVLLVRAQAVF